MTTRPLPSTLAAAVLALGALPTLAQQADPPPGRPAAASRAADDTLYRALGGREGIQRFTADFYGRMLQDARIAHFFDGVNTAYLTRVLADYFCVAAGGPCEYDGVSMADAHAHLGIRQRDFNALVEHLQDAMAADGVPFATQNQLLARLAFHHREVVTK